MTVGMGTMRPPRLHGPDLEERQYISEPSPDGNGDGRADVLPFDLVQRLVTRAREGDADAFEQLYRQHHAGIYRFFRFHLGTDVDDAVAEVFLRAWRGLPSYRDVGVPFQAWLFGIARHVAVDELRRRGRCEPRDDLPEGAVEPMSVELLDLRNAVELLPQIQRQVIELKFLLGLTNDEVASALRTTSGAVNAKQWRGLKTLANILGGNDGYPDRA